MSRHVHSHTERSQSLRHGAQRSASLPAHRSRARNLAYVFSCLLETSQRKAAPLSTQLVMSRAAALPRAQIATDLLRTCEDVSSDGAFKAQTTRMSPAAPQLKAQLVQQQHRCQVGLRGCRERRRSASANCEDVSNDVVRSAQTVRMSRAVAPLLAQIVKTS